MMRDQRTMVSETVPSNRPLHYAQCRSSCRPSRPSPSSTAKTCVFAHLVYHPLSIQVPEHSDVGFRSASWTKRKMTCKSKRQARLRLQGVFASHCVSVLRKPYYYSFISPSGPVVARTPCLEYLLEIRTLVLVKALTSDVPIVKWCCNREILGCTRMQVLW